MSRWSQKGEQPAQREPRAQASSRWELTDDAICAVIVWTHTGANRADKGLYRSALYAALRREAATRGLEAFVRGAIGKQQQADRLGKYQGAQRGERGQRAVSVE